jgi:hypothetical protein
MYRPILYGLLALDLLAALVSAALSIPGRSSYVAPEGFPTSAFAYVL